VTASDELGENRDLVGDLIADLQEDDEIFGPDGPCPIAVTVGARTDLVLITGESASGKSFVCSYLGMLAQASDPERRPTEFMHVGMNLRAASGMQRALMFGNEAQNSTGAISVRTMLTGFSNSRNRERTHILCLDEPDIGLSEDAAEGCGDMIADFARTPPPRLAGLIVVTHSRAIARAVMTLDPIRIRVGADAGTTEHWLEHRRPVAVETLLALADTNRARFLAIRAIMNARETDKA
jgi:hypothetical protein